MLHENLKLYCSGTNSMNESHSIPELINIDKKFPEFFNNNDFCPVRILSAWNRTLSIIYVTIADARSFQNTSNAKQKSFQILSTLANKWRDSNLLPPYIESIASNFSQESMRKSTVFSVTKKLEAPKSGVAKLKELLEAGPIYSDTAFLTDGKHDERK